MDHFSQDVSKACGQEGSAGEPLRSMPTDGTICSSARIHEIFPELIQRQPTWQQGERAQRAAAVNWFVQHKCTLDAESHVDVCIGSVLWDVQYVRICPVSQIIG